MGYKMKSDVTSLIHGMKPSLKKSLPKGVHGVTLDDGTIVINNKLSPVQQKIAESHERVHREQILRKDLSYDEDYVYWKNKKYPRKGMREGFPKLAWEAEAYAKQKKK
jgi:hypothetical protein